MKITDISITLFKWEGLPAIGYLGLARKAGEPGELALLSIKTDDGVEGLSFLGKATVGAAADAAALIKFLKPMLMGQNPLDRERLNEAIWRRRRMAGIYAIGAVDVALWDLAGKAANMPIHRLLGSFRDKIPVYASSDHLPSPQHYADEALKFKAMNWKWLCAAPAVAMAERHQGLRSRAQGCRRRLSANARFDLDLRLHRGAQGRPRHRGDGILLVRGSALRPGRLQLRQAEGEARHSDHGD